MTTPTPLRDYPVVQRDPILSALFEDLRAKLRPGDVSMVTEFFDEETGVGDFRVWVSHNSPGRGREFGPHRPTLAQAIDALIAKLR